MFVYSLYPGGGGLCGRINKLNVVQIRVGGFLCASVNASMCDCVQVCADECVRVCVRACARARACVCACGSVYSLYLGGGRIDKFNVLQIGVGSFLWLAFESRRGHCAYGRCLTLFYFIF